MRHSELSNGRFRRGAPGMIARMNAIQSDADTPATTRVVVSAAEAARRCCVGRATIQRSIEAKRFPHAVKGENGWEISLQDLEAAGFDPYASERSGELEADTAHHWSDTHNLPSPAKQLLELELQLIRARADTEIERVRYEGAVQVAEERLRVITAQGEALEAAMRRLTALQARLAPAPAPSAVRERLLTWWNRASRRQAR